MEIYICRISYVDRPVNKTNYRINTFLNSGPRGIIISTKV